MRGAEPVTPKPIAKPALKPAAAAAVPKKPKFSIPTKTAKNDFATTPAGQVTADAAAVEEEEKLKRLPMSVQAIYLKPLKHTAKYGIPSCDLQLRSYSLRPLEFFADFALRAAFYLNLPAYGPVNLPQITERWTVPRSHFIFKKSQENFERVTKRRLIQIRDGHPEAIQVWLAFLRKHAFYGVGMKANVWEFSELGKWPREVMCEMWRILTVCLLLLQVLARRWMPSFPSRKPWIRPGVTLPRTVRTSSRIWRIWRSWLSSPSSAGRTAMRLLSRLKRRSLLKGTTRNKADGSGSGGPIYGPCKVLFAHCMI